jgi:beta-lactamase regulating signal transducer with metallopeptidase domain
MTDIFMTVLNMSLTAGFIIAALCLARFVLKQIHAPKWISYVLWAVAGLRLAVPVTFESVLSLLPMRVNDIAAVFPAAKHEYHAELFPAAPQGALIDIERSPLGFGGVTVYDTLSWIWLIGIAVMLLYAVISYIRLIRLKDGVTTPFVYGFFKPKIHIPQGLTGEELRYVTLHEQTHIKRRDYLVKPFAFALLCVHWFNPLAWLAFVLMCSDMEMSCDERVLRELGSGAKADYSATLLSLSANRRILNASPLAFGEGGLKERVKNVLNFKKRSRIIIIAAVALVAVLSVGFAVNRAQDGTTTRDLRNFSVYDFVLGEPIRNDLIESYVPTDRYSDDYDYNFENVRYSLDAETGAIRKLWYNLNGNGYMTSGISATRWQKIEQVTSYYGEGRQGWQDREQGLRYVEYTQKDGRLSATVRFVYDNSENGLVWVIAESTLPYPMPPETSAPQISLYEYSDNHAGYNPSPDLNNVDGLTPILPGNDGWTVLNDTVTIAATAPIGTVKAVIYYAETGTEQVGQSISEANNAKPLAEPRISTGDFPVTEWFPNGFLGHFWAVTTDADGIEHTSEIVNAIYEPKGAATPQAQ